LLVQQLVHNLYSNAVKYNIPNGWMKFTLRRDGTALTFKIENPAASIPLDLREKAFHRFYRGDAARNRRIDGSGLGLSICKAIATLHHATLSLAPTPQATVIVSLQAPLG
jgi:signal transduction histidine kinase